MDEELDILYNEDMVDTEDIEDAIEVEEIIEAVEIETLEEVEVNVDEAVGWVGGDSTRHYSLYGRDEPDQHPITSIIGLREELNDIEALGVVYSNKRNQADYYLWEDENILQENRVGYFVSACSDIDKIKMCTSDNDIFGVTVDSAGFIGAQDDVARDIKYGLVVTAGIVHVRCESSVEVGDYVVSNDYGYAQKNTTGYKVAGRHLIDGVEYAEITLVTPISRMCELDDDVENLQDRMDDAETNIVAAINVANAAYNKASEVGEVSEEAIKNALEALNKSNENSEVVNNIGENVSSAKEISAQAKVIAESAVVSAVAIRDEAVATSNNALKNVNDLIKDLEPIASWGNLGEYITIDTWDSTDKDTSKVYYTTDTKLYYYYYEGEWASASELNIGASYMAKYIKDDVATKAEIETAESQLKTHTSLIEKNAKGFHTLVASIDKYSIGEYSQAYGLTYEQAKSILKEGMIYIPIGSLDGTTHIEEYEGQGQQNEFTEQNYYRWTGDDWEEHIGAVVFSKEIPSHMNSLEYWYVNSDEAPEGYEPKTLYMSDNNKWVKVNVFYGNPNNRMSSSIGQEVDKISLEITNARGSAASVSARITNTESEVQSLALWSKGGKENGEQYNLATIKQTADDAGASIAQVVESVGEDGKVTAASIVAAVNDDTSGVTINADHINLNGRVTIGDLNNDAKSSIVTSSIIEYGLSDSATVRPTEWSENKEWVEGKYMWQRTTVTKADNSQTTTHACIQGSKGKDGTGVTIKGVAYVNSTINDESIGNLYTLYSDSEHTTQLTNIQSGDAYLVDGYLLVYNGNNKFVCTGKIQGPKGDTGATGQNGANGYTPYKGQNGNWWINGQDTGIKAQGVDGKDGKDGKDGQTPTIGISLDGYWVINGTKTDVKAIGKDGTNGVSVTRVVSQYIVSTSKTSAPSNSNTNWTDNFDTTLTTYYTNKKNNPTKSYYIWSREKVEYSSGNPTYSTPTVNSANSAIANWCVENDVTKINGANIATGTIDATAVNVTDLKAFNARIGNWRIQDGFLQGYTDNDNYVTMWAPNSGVSNFINVKYDGDYTFRVTPTGYLYASNANISGKITATSGSFTGTITADDGNIGGWNINPTRIISTVSGSKKEFYLASAEATGFDNWIVAKNADGTTTFKLSKTGVLTATEADIKGKITATSGSFDRDVTIGGRSLSKWITSGGYVYNIKATSGSIGNWHIGLDGDGKTLFGNNEGDGSSVVLMPEGVDRIPINGSIMSATWYQIISAATGSDRRLKDNIKDIDNKYELLFNLLKPQTFNYKPEAKYGESNDVHFGFIAQDILSTQSDLGLDDLSFVIEEKYYSLKMQEFIALNTWQIQKAKARITELENRVAQLEALIKE